jgi:hypothetical protein
MKTLLAILLSFVITEAPVFAIHGGYTLGGSQSLIGTYAGVLVPTSNTLLVSTASNFGLDALGLFTLSVPSTGIGTGSAIIFADGYTFTGTIRGIPNPNDSTAVSGVINANFDYNYTYITTSGSAVTTTVTASAQGPFDATTSSDTESSGGQGVDLSGTATLNISDGFVDENNGTPIVAEDITFAVEGYLQSTSVSTTSD